MGRRACIVFNWSAGRRASARRARIEEALAARFDLTVLEARRGGDFRAAVGEAVARRPEMVIACGGDGTVSTLADGLCDTGVALGIIPGGTANSVARALGIPTDIEAACENLARGHVRTLDVATVRRGRARPRTMVLMASVGLHADTIAGTPRAWKRRWGAWAYLAMGLKQMLDLHPFDVVLETERAVVRCRANAVTIANLAPPTSVWAHGPALVEGDDGLLDVTVVAAKSAFEALSTGLHLLRSASAEAAATRDNVGFFRCRRLRVTATPAQHVTVDGEAAGSSPVEVICRPACLRVVAPEAAPRHAPDEAKLAGLPEVEVEAKAT